MTNLGPHRSWSWPIRVGVATAALALVVVLGQGVVATPSAEAQGTLTVLYSFGSSGNADGFTPQGGLLRDPAGNLYGTTYHGGARRCGFGDGCGTVFRLDTTGREAVLYRFSRVSDGLYPLAGLVRDAAGNLYGTANQGGASNWGTVFKLDTTGSVTVLHSFTGGTDGSFPGAGLIWDAAGNLYGTTSAGGASNGGTVFKLDATGTETVLYSFTGMDGKNPVAGLVRDAAGNLYGTTQLGGAFDLGTVFKLDTTGVETVLHSFHGRDGGYPYCSLVRDAAGNFYGTTNGGGASGQGTVFKVNGTGRETVLYSFTGQLDGEYLYAGLVRDPAGNLYGTTYAGGDSKVGTVFKLDTTGAETVLYSFTGGADGSSPQAGLIRDAAGNLYGTTVGGGTFGGGTVFKLSFP